jgi:hypothetical protein
MLPKATVALCLAGAVCCAHCESASALSYVCQSPDVLQSFTNTSAPGTRTGSIQSLIIPGDSVTIDAAGAQGGFIGGLGAEVVATVTVTPGSTLCAVLGTQGDAATGVAGGGGGGTFVYVIDSGTCESNLSHVVLRALPQLLVVAAGGGGGGVRRPVPLSADGVAPSDAGTAGAATGSTGEFGGRGGEKGNGGVGSNVAGGGGGLLTNGTSAPQGFGGGVALVHGAAGGGSVLNSGGFGGGGAGGASGGGGGGFNGGGGAGEVNQDFGAGGGGGSYSSTAPLAPFTLSGVQSGNGAVNVCYHATTPVRLQTFGVD